MLDEVWACLRQAGVKGGCNVMLYRDLPTAGHVAVEVGVEVSEPLAVTGAVMMSALPAGLAAGTTHRGPYEEIDAAHQAVLPGAPSAARPPASAERLTATGTKTPPSCRPWSSIACARRARV